MPIAKINSVNIGKIRSRNSMLKSSVSYFGGILYIGNFPALYQILLQIPDFSQCASSGEATYAQLFLPLDENGDPQQSHVFWFHIGTSVEPTSSTGVIGSPIFDRVQGDGLSPTQLLDVLAQAVVNTGKWVIQGYAPLGESVTYLTLWAGAPDQHYLYAPANGVPTTMWWDQKIKNNRILKLSAIWFGGFAYDSTSYLYAVVSSDINGSGTVYGISPNALIGTVGQLWPIELVAPINVPANDFHVSFRAVSVAGQASNIIAFGGYTNGPGSFYLPGELYDANYDGQGPLINGVVQDAWMQLDVYNSTPPAIVGSPLLNIDANNAGTTGSQPASVTDSSTHANHAVQADITKRPTIIVGANGQKFLNFTAPIQRLVLTTPIDIAGDWEFLVVTKKPLSTSTLIPLIKNAAPFTYCLYHNVDANTYSFNQEGEGAYVVGQEDTNTNVWRVQNKLGHRRVWKNGVELTIGGNYSGEVGTGVDTIGSFVGDSGDTGGDGSIGLLKLWHGCLTNTDGAAQDAAAMAQYGIS